MTEEHAVHAHAPSAPDDGQRYTCHACHLAWEWVILDDGLPGEWVSVESG